MKQKLHLFPILKKKHLESTNNYNLSVMPTSGKHFKLCCVALNSVNKLVIKTKNYCLKNKDKWRLFLCKNLEKEFKRKEVCDTFYFS